MAYEPMDKHNKVRHKCCNEAEKKNNIKINWFLLINVLHVTQVNKTNTNTTEKIPTSIPNANKKKIGKREKNFIFLIESN